MDEIEYLNWLIKETIKKYPELEWFMGCIRDSLNDQTIIDIRYYYEHDCTDWEVLKYCAYQSAPLNIEHTTNFIGTIFKLLSNETSDQKLLIM
ncbi:hypothetical protein NM09_16850 [Vibrio caribbeanicus]|uniref:Uncharacterized protein n=1 Tax=Vibrio caribbeanicus TaxID=701175 RepID=A0ACC4NT76_9VIBR|nr:hypothetical protein NM09_16850 [Vibrio caribbeanicus]